MELDDDQMAYLRWHDIPLDALLNAHGLSGNSLRRAMEAEGKYFAYNTNRCNRGHRLKSRSGHCIQCRPACIAFLKRHFADGYVYIAGSMAGKLLKVGTTQDVRARSNHLNSLRYGGRGDWRVAAYSYTTNAGQVEGEAHVRLARHAFSGELRDNRGQRCIELFRCDFAEAKLALEQSLGEPMTHVEAWAMEKFTFL